MLHMAIQIFKFKLILPAASDQENLYPRKNSGEKKLNTKQCSKCRDLKHTHARKKDPTTMPVSSEKILLHFIRKLDIKWELTFAPLIPALFTLN